MGTDGDRRRRSQEVSRLLGRRLVTMRAANGIRQEEVGSITAD